MAGGSELCVPGLNLPAGTGRVQMEIDTGGAPQPALAARISGAGGRPIASAQTPAVPQPGRRKVAFAIPERPASPESVPVSLCVRTAGNVAFGGMSGVPGGFPVPVIDGRPSPNPRGDLVPAAGR